MNKINIVNYRICYDIIFLFDSFGNSYELSVKLPFKDFKKCLNSFNFKPSQPAAISRVSRQHIICAYFVLREYNLNVASSYKGSIN